MPTQTPRLTVGLPVYNGERFLAQALDDLLAQTVTDLEVVISDNASTDATPAIARAYAARDPRVRYLRQDHNLGAAGNHDAVLAAARGRYFAWGSDDDRYAPTLYERCLAALEADPGLVLAHAHAAFIGEDGSVVAPAPYLLDTSSPDPAQRLRSLLHGSGGNDFYGVARTEVFREIGPLGSFHNADRVHVTAFALRGRFHQVPEVLYFRRDHPGRGERLPGLRARCVGLDPRRADRLRHPIARLLIEYVVAYVRLILRAPLSGRDRARCLQAFGGWLLSRVLPGRGRRIMATTDPAVSARRGGGRLRVAALGYYGIGNLGNEALLTAFADRLQRDLPEAQLSVLAVDPAAVRAEHGLPATRLMTYRRDLAGGGPVVTVLKVLGRIADVPRLFRAVGRVDAVVVPSSGVMETGLGLRPWGLSYWLFVVALSCRLRGRRLALVSIGAQPGRDLATRLLHRWTAGLATSISVRDEGSYRALVADGVRRPVGLAPDLVFGLDLEAGAEAARPGQVALGAMAYYGGPQTPERGPAVREAYTAALAKLTDELVARGYAVTLVIGDAADREVAEDVAARAGARVVRVSPATTLVDVATELARAEVVVASRFHTLVAALVLGRPCVALGYAPKSAELLTAFGLDAATQPMDRIDAAALAAQLERARGLLPDRTTLPRLRAALDFQYDQLWKELRP